MDEIKAKLAIWFKGGFNLYKENFVLIFISTIVVGLLTFVSVGILAGPLAIGYMLILFRLLQKSSPAPTISDVFGGFDKFKSSFLLIIVSAVANWFGSFILHHVPIIGNLLAYLYSTSLVAMLIFALPIIADKNLDFWSAMELSIETVKPKFFLYLIFTFIGSLIVGSGTLLIIIGVFLTTPIYVCSIAVAYKDVIGITNLNQSASA